MALHVEIAVTISFSLVKGSGTNCDLSQKQLLQTETFTFGSYQHHFLHQNLIFNFQKGRLGRAYRRLRNHGSSIPDFVCLKRTILCWHDFIRVDLEIDYKCFVKQYYSLWRSICMYQVGRNCESLILLLLTPYVFHSQLYRSLLHVSLYFLEAGGSFRATSSRD